MPLTSAQRKILTDILTSGGVSPQRPAEGCNQLTLFNEEDILHDNRYQIYLRRKRTKVALKCGKTMTQQNFKDECDINSIMSKYQVTGFLVDPLKPIS